MSVLPVSSSTMVLTISSKALRSLPNACARSGSFQTSEDSNSRLTSTKRSALRS